MIAHPRVLSDPRFKTIEEAAYKTVAKFFEALCGKSDKRHEVTGLQMEMQSQFVRQLYDVREFCLDSQTKLVQEAKEENRRLNESNLKLKAEHEREAQKVKAEIEERVAQLARDTQTRMDQMLQEFDTHNHHFRLHTCSFLEAKNLLERRADEATAREKAALGRVSALEALLAGMESPEKQQQDLLTLRNKVQQLEADIVLEREKLEYFHRKHEGAEQQLEAKITTLTRELEAAKAQKPKGKTGLDAEAQTDPMEPEKQATVEEVQELHDMIDRLQHELDQAEQKCIELDELHAHAHRELESRYVRKLAEIMAAHDEELGKQRQATMAAEALASNIHDNMSKQTRGMLHRVGAMQTEHTKRVIARHSNKMEFADFSGAYSRLLGSEGDAVIAADHEATAATAAALLHHSKTQALPEGAALAQGRLGSWAGIDDATKTRHPVEPTVDEKGHATSTAGQSHLQRLRLDALPSRTTGPQPKGGTRAITERGPGKKTALPHRSSRTGAVTDRSEPDTSGTGMIVTPSAPAPLPLARKSSGVLKGRPRGVGAWG